MKRRSEFDVARGLMLVLMTVTHVPTQFSQRAGQPFGYVSAAEGFVMLSAFMAGLVYTTKAAKGGLPAMRAALLARAGTVYVCQAALLVFLFSVVAWLGIKVQQPAVTDMISFYMNQPLTGLFSGFALLYNPPLLDILPLYVLLLLATPFVLAHALRRGWAGVLALSLLLWFATQFGLGQWLYEHVVAPAGFPVPYREMGSFETLGWQLLWVIGLWMGVHTAQAAEGADAFGKFPRWVLLVAWAYALVFLTWRHVTGQLPTPNPMAMLNVEFDKWSVGPLRLLNFLALLVLAVQHGPGLLAWLPRMRWLQLLGQASLPVFCVQLVLVLLALVALGAPDPNRAVWIDLALLAASFAVLTVTALVSRALDRQVQGLRERRASRPQAQLRAPPA